uniref:CCHC-type domain-containing protein n=1 Tax=Oryza glumipatula TaxID=40148 RepID=A0A0E0A9Y9_9ORYZ
MASEEFISLGEPCEADAKDEEETNLQTIPPNLNEVNPLASEGESGPVDNTKASDGIIDLEGQDQVDGEPSTMDSTKVPDVIIDLEEGQVEDMDLSDDDVVVKHQHLDASIQSSTSVADVQTLHGVSVELDKGNGLENGSHASKSILIDESTIRGVKRARVESTEPSVRVIYSNLTRESKRKLVELMQQWSEWQTRKQNTLTKAGEEVLECGEETYYPALHVGSEKSCAVSFWVDSQAKEGVVLDDDLVPLYDREFTLGSTPLGDPSNTESRADKDDSRCFNCGSYSHALKECPKPRDNAAINNARKQHNMKRNQSNVNRGQNRYYQKTPGKFDDLRPGILGPETRECLGIGENDPPPWLHRMRELGYPPGYLDVVDDEDKPSGITIFGDEDPKEEYEEGELPDQGEPSPPRKKKTVEFPGINGPIPENGDRWLWDSTPPQYSERYHSSDSREQRDRGPPGADRYSRYHSYDYGPASPSHGRSHPDRGWRSSSGYENLPADDGAWTPHAYSSRQYSSQYSTSSETSSRHSRDRHDRHYHHRR